METYEELERMESEPVILANHDGLIFSINRCFAETFKWTDERLVGSLINDIMPAKYRDSHTMGISRFLTTESRTLPEHALDLEVLCGDGTSLKSRHTIVAAQIDGKWKFAGKVVPLTKDGR